MVATSINSRNNYYIYKLNTSTSPNTLGTLLLKGDTSCPNKIACSIVDTTPIPTTDYVEITHSLSSVNASNCQLRAGFSIVNDATLFPALRELVNFTDNTTEYPGFVTGRRISIPQHTLTIFTTYGLENLNVTNFNNATTSEPFRQNITIFTHNSTKYRYILDISSSFFLYTFFYCYG